MISYLQSVFFQTLEILLIFALPLLLTALCMHYVSAAIRRKLLVSVGWNLYLFLFAWLGTSVHECGHALFCLLFRHRITEMKLFSPDRESGTLGYVAHQYDRGSLFQNIGNFFIGIGPIILGVAIISLAGFLLLGVNFSMLAGSRSYDEIISRLSAIKSPLWMIILFIYLSFSIGSSITLSPPDISSGFRGAFFLLLFIFFAHFALFWSEPVRQTMISFYRSMSYGIIGIMIVVLLLNIALLLAVTVISSLFTFSRAN